MTFKKNMSNFVPTDGLAPNRSSDDQFDNGIFPCTLAWASYPNCFINDDT